MIVVEGADVPTRGAGGGDDDLGVSAGTDYDKLLVLRHLVLRVEEVGGRKSGHGAGGCGVCATVALGTRNKDL